MPASINDVRAFYRKVSPPKYCVAYISVSRNDPGMALTQSVGMAIRNAQTPATPNSYWLRDLDPNEITTPSVCSSRAWSAGSSSPLAHIFVLNLDSKKTKAPHTEAEELADVVTVVNAGGSLQDPLAVHSLDSGQEGLFRCREAFRLWHEFAREFRSNPYFRAEARAKADAQQSDKGPSQGASGDGDGGAENPAGDAEGATDGGVTDALMAQAKARQAAASPGSLRSSDLGAAPKATAEMVRVGHAINLPELAPGETVRDVPGMPALCSKFEAFTVTRDEGEEGANEVKREPWRSWRSVQARHGKATLDFALALDFCSNSVGAEYAFILEDDSLMARSWLTKLDRGVLPAAEAFAAAEERKNPLGSEAAPAEQDVPRMYGYDADNTRDAAPLLSKPMPIPAGLSSLFTPLVGTSDAEAISAQPAGQAEQDRPQETGAQWRHDAFVEQRHSALQRRVAWVKLFYPDFLEQWGLEDVVWLVSWAIACASVAALALSAAWGMLRLTWSPIQLRLQRASSLGGAAKEPANCCVCGVLRSTDSRSSAPDSAKRHALSLQRASGCGCSGMATHRSTRWVLHCQSLVSVARLLVCCDGDPSKTAAAAVVVGAGAGAGAGAEEKKDEENEEEMEEREQVEVDKHLSPELSEEYTMSSGGDDTPAGPEALILSRSSSGNEDAAVGRRRGASSRLGATSTQTSPASHSASSAGLEVVGCVCPASRDAILSLVAAAILSALLFVGLSSSAGKSAVRTMPWQRPGVHSFTTGCCIVGTVFPRTSAMQLAWEMRTYWAAQAELSDFAVTFAGLAFHTGKLRMLATPHLVQHVGFVSTQPFSDMGQSWKMRQATPSKKLEAPPEAAPAKETPRPQASPAARSHLARAFFERFNLPEPAVTWDEPSPTPSPTPSNAASASPPSILADGVEPPDPTLLSTDLLNAPKPGASEEDVLRWGWQFWDALQWNRRFYNEFFGFSFAFDEPACDAVEVGLPPGTCRTPRW